MSAGVDVCRGFFTFVTIDSFPVWSFIETFKVFSSFVFLPLPGKDALAAGMFLD